MTVHSALSKFECWSLLGLVGVSLAIIYNTLQGDGEPLIASIAFSGVAFSFAYALIRWLGPTFIKAGLKGKDMAKPRKPEMYANLSFPNDGSNKLGWTLTQTW
jgi:UDP-N-acetylglucosamine--dolichyl-phosphate N-acetylglucosaminephosphotransferase